MSSLDLKIELRSSPHVKYPVTVAQIMRNVVYALVPVCLFAVYAFGLSAVLLLLVTTGTCILAETVFCRLAGSLNTIHDWSIVITGLLLALTLPPGFPLWMAVIASLVAVGLGKALFGGLGCNVMNPALVGRAFVQAAFPGAMTTWTPPFAEGRWSEIIPSTLTAPLMKPPPLDGWLAQLSITPPDVAGCLELLRQQLSGLALHESPTYPMTGASEQVWREDVFTGATPLALQKFDQVSTSAIDLMTGMTAGSAGETSAVIILAGGIYLAARRMLDWRIPAAVLLGAAVTSLPFWLANPGLYPDPLFVLCSGGLMLGAVFMASDMVASPVTPVGVWLYGLLIGLLTVLIRLFGALPEGVMYAILLGNAWSPLIASFTQPKVFGLDKTGSDP
jgi:electron transport complex protein RnfD